MAPSISVVIATYKRAHLICRALDSVAKQTISPLEIIVIDDASGDDSGDVVAKWSTHNGFPVRFLIAEQNGGVGVARNIAMRQARGDYIAFLDSDDEYLPQALETLAAPLAAHPEIIVSFADAQQIGSDNRPPVPMMRRCLSEERDTAPLDPNQPQWRRLNDPQSVLLTTSMIPTCAAIFRRSSAVAVGLMPEYRHGEDWIFWLKLSDQGAFCCQFIDVAWIFRGDNNLTGPANDAANAHMGLNALLGLYTGRFDVKLTPENRARLKLAISEKAKHFRYHTSRKGLRSYWNSLGSSEALATGGRLRHLLRDPKSLLRAVLA